MKWYLKKARSAGLVALILTLMAVATVMAGVGPLSSSDAEAKGPPVMDHDRGGLRWTGMS